MKLRNKMLALSFIALYGGIASAEVILIPSDYEDYTYSQAENFKDTGQMKDETYSDFVHRENFMEEDMELQGYFVDDE